MERTIYVAAGVAAVVPALESYSSISSPRHAGEESLRVAEGTGWTAVRLPDRVHPWQLHNLAVWLLDVPGVGKQVVAESAASAMNRRYSLVPDPKVAEWLCGWDEAGDGWTVNVPNNEIARPDVAPVSTSIAAPGGFSGWRTIIVRMEDPGREMNPALEATVKTRRDLARRQRGVPIDLANV